MTTQTTTTTEGQMMTTSANTTLVSVGTYLPGDKQFNSQTRSFYKITKDKIGKPIAGTVLRALPATR